MAGEPSPRRVDIRASPRTHVGVAERFHVVAGLAEELPFEAESFDAIYSQGCVHHWVTRVAMPECHRVLRPGGRFAAVEPWRAPFYEIGTKLFGKRQRDVHCVVLTPDRVEPYIERFHEPKINHHWSLSRYPLIALDKLGLRLSRGAVWRIGAVDDALASRFPRLRDAGSSVAILRHESRPSTLPLSWPRPAVSAAVLRRRPCQPAVSERRAMWFVGRAVGPSWCLPETALPAPLPAHLWWG